MPSIKSQTWTQASIAEEYAVIKAKGWLSLFEAAAFNIVRCLDAKHAHLRDTHLVDSTIVGGNLSMTGACSGPVEVFRPSDGMGSASRESGKMFWDKFPDGAVVGDHGNALGLLQVNIVYNPHILGLETPEVNIPYGMMVMAKFEDAIMRESLLAKFTLPLQNYVRNLDWAKVGAYNKGVNGVLNSWSNHGDPDAVTANGDYGEDTLARRTAFEQEYLKDFTS